MVKALVTGGAGFIGSNLVISLVEKGYQVTVVDDLSMGVKANLATVADQIEFHEHDVCDHEFMHSIITGYAQVNGGYDISPEEKCHLDNYYIENYSFTFDIKIALETIKTMFTGDGAR